jgi:hypothetical protein
VAIVALVLWTFTAAVGVYLLITSTRIHPDETVQAEPVGAPTTAGAAAVWVASAAGTASAGAAPGAARVSPAQPSVHPGDRFDPPSLREAKIEPMPGMRALGEFMHPALAITGFGFWVAYTWIRDDVFAAIALGVILGAVAAGLAYAAANARAAKREGSDTLSFSPRVVILHVVGAGLTVVLAALIVAHVF